jgi:type IV pilus assembly protein PilY1
VLKGIVADSGPGNGLSSVAPVDVDDDKRIDYIYAGDLKGNIWRFDSVADGYGWRLGHGGLPIFTARDANGNVQPITIRPAVFKRKNGSLMVVFGTGKFFETSDAAANPSVTHSLYGVLDRLDGTPTITRDDLLQQEFLAGATHFGFELRESSDYPMTWHQTAGMLPTGSEEVPAYLGWYLDLIDPTQAFGSQSVGELVAAEVRVRGDRIIFTSMIPSEEPCDFGGEGWLIELSYLTGQRPSDVLFDLDGDGLFTAYDQPRLDSNDQDSPRLNPNAKKSKIGIIQQPAIIGDGGREYKYASGGMPADVEVTTENPGNASGGRASWLELE